MTEIRTAIPEEVDAYLDALVRKGIFSNKAELVRAALVDYVNSTGTFSRGFDAETIFAPDGRLYQLEYAREAASKGGTAVGLVCEEGVLLAAEVVAKSKLAPGGKKIHAIGERIGVVSSGLASDGALLVDELRSATPKTTEEAVRIVRAALHRFTLSRTLRPLGVALLMGTVVERRPRLFYMDPSGAGVEKFATAMGRGADGALEILEAKYRKMRLADAERLVPEVFGRDTPTEVLRLAT